MDDVWSHEEDDELERLYQEEIERCRAELDETETGTSEFWEKMDAYKVLKDEYAAWREDSEHRRRKFLGELDAVDRPELVEVEVEVAKTEDGGPAPERHLRPPSLGGQIRWRTQLVYKSMLNGREQIGKDAKQWLFDHLPPDVAQAKYDKAVDDARERLANNPPFRSEEEVRIVLGTRILELAMQPELFGNSKTAPKDRAVVLAVFSIAYRRGMVNNLWISRDQIVAESTVPLTSDEVRRAIDRVDKKKLWFTVKHVGRSKNKANNFRVRQDLIENDPRLMSKDQVKAGGLLEEVERRPELRLVVSR